MNTEQGDQDQGQSARDSVRQTLLNLENVGLSTLEQKAGAFVAQALLNLEKVGMLEDKETLQDVLDEQYGNEDAARILDAASRELVSDESDEDRTEDSYKKEAYDALSMAWYISTGQEGGLDELARSLDRMLQDIWDDGWRNL